LTQTGRTELEAWLLGRDTVFEMRDENLLRLFFADSLPHDEALQLLEGRKRAYDQVLEELRAIDARPGVDPPFVDLVLRWGIDFSEWGAKWCEAQLQRLSAETAKTA
jgi:Virulence activator alpha C-term